MDGPRGRRWGVVVEIAGKARRVGGDYGAEESSWRVGWLAGEVRMVKRAEAEYLGLTFGGEMIGCGEHVRGYWFGDGARGSSVSWTRRRAAWDGTCGRVECFGEMR